MRSQSIKTPILGFSHPKHRKVRIITLASAPNIGKTNAMDVLTIRNATTVIKVKNHD
mgnify:CR=1 FL=1